MLQLFIGPDVLFADDIQRQQVELFEDCKVNDFQDPLTRRFRDNEAKSQTKASPRRASEKQENLILNL